MDQQNQKNLQADFHKLMNFTKITKFILICLAVVWVGLWFVDLPRWQYRSEKIEYERLDKTSIVGNDYYCDRPIICTKAFELYEALTKNGVSVSPLGKTNAKHYYLAIDNSGFSFLLCVDNDEVNKLEARLASSESESLYGVVEKLPEKVNVDTAQYMMENLDLSDFQDSEWYDNVKNDIYEIKNNFNANFKNMTVLHVDMSDPMERSVKDGETFAYRFLSGVKFSLFVAMVVLFFWRKRKMTGFFKKVKLAALSSQPNAEGLDGASALKKPFGQEKKDCLIQCECGEMYRGLYCPVCGKSSKKN